MHFEFEHLGTTTPFELSEGQHLLGGGPEDQVRLEGLPPGLLTLRIEGSRLTVEAAQAFTVNEVWVPPRVARLVLPGEVVGLPEGMRLQLLPAANGHERGVGTVAVLKRLLTDGDGQVPSRAATLTCLTGLDVGRTFPLAEAKTEIGRGSRVDFRLRDRAISRIHARILREDSTFTLVDLNSPNGLYLNGRRVRGSAPLAEGDVLELGCTLLRFQATLEEQAPPLIEPAAPLATPRDMPVPSSGGTTRWFIGLGVAAAFAGMLVTYALVG